MTEKNNKERHEQMLSFALAALRAVDGPVTAKTKRDLRRQIMQEFTCSNNTGWRIVEKACKILSGEPVSEWGGAREDAGPPIGNKNASKKRSDNEQA